MAEINDGMYTLNEFKNKGVLRLAPDFYVMVGGSDQTRVLVSKTSAEENDINNNGSTSSEYQDASYQNINFRSGVTQFGTSHAVTPGSGSCSLTYVCPQYSSLNQSLYVTNPNGTKTPYFQAMMEVKVYSKGRFMREEGGELIPAYYPIFWGFIVAVNEAYNSSESVFTLTCRDMLGWWEYQNVNVVGTPVASRWGAPAIHNTGTLYRLMNPWEIILNLFQETTFDNFIYPALTKGTVPPEVGLPNGAKAKWKDKAGNVMDAWRNRYGMGTQHPDSLNEDSAFSNLEMFGVSGIIPLTGSASRFSLEQSAAVKEEMEGERVTPTRPSNTAESNITPQQQGTTDKDSVKKSTSKTSGDLVYRVKEFQKIGSKVDIDFSVFGRVLPYGAFDSFAVGTEPTRSSKLEVAATVAGSIHFEFFQDTNGMFVFKPPFYNMDTSKNPVYVIKPGDIISADFAEDSSQIVTFIEASGPILMQSAAVDYTSVHADFGLMKKYGIREATVKVAYGNSPQELRAMAASEMAKTNAKSQTGSLTIVHRPEIRVGYPIYIEHMDTYYYVTCVQHSTTMGSTASTTLTLEAKRTRIYGDDGVPLRGYIQKSFEKSQETKDDKDSKDVAIEGELKKALSKQGIQIRTDGANSAKGALGSREQVVEAYKNSQSSTSTSYYDQELAPSDKYYRDGGYISSPEPGFYNIVQSEAFKNLANASSDAEKDGSAAFTKALADGDLSELTHFTLSTLPYTDMNGFYHIGGFPYGANMVLTANNALLDYQKFYGNDVAAFTLDSDGKTSDPMEQKVIIEDIETSSRKTKNKKILTSDASGSVGQSDKSTRGTVAKIGTQENPTAAIKQEAVIDTPMSKISIEELAENDGG